MKHNNQTLHFLIGELEQTYGWAQTERVQEQARKLLEQLCTENSSEPPAVRKHTAAKIYPVIAVYRSMQAIGISREESLSFLDGACSRQAEPSARSLRKLLKLGGLWKKYPAMYARIAKQNFGEKAGFRQTFYDLGKHRCRFDMTQCLYYDTCRRCGCPELTLCFCHTDDVTTEDVHPRILWNRTQTIGEGAPFCDFDVIALREGETAEDYRTPSEGETAEASQKPSEGES